MLSFNDINILGNIIDTTFGRSSSPSGSMSIKAHLAGDKLVVVYNEIVNIASDREKAAQVTPIVDRGMVAIKKKKAEFEKEFKRVAKSALSLKEISDASELLPMGYNYLNPIRPTHFKLTVTYTVG
jgi:F0F1-type ATP synthase gamma subunit